MHGFTQVCMVLQKCAWFCTAEHALTQECMVLYTAVHGLHTDTWFYASVHGFIHPWFAY